MFGLFIISFLSFFPKRDIVTRISFSPCRCLQLFYICHLYRTKRSLQIENFLCHFSWHICC